MLIEKNKTNTAIIGAAGYWAKNLVRTIKQIPDFDLKYACDIKFQDGHFFDEYGLFSGTKKISDYKEVIEDKDISVVFISTPPTNHYEICKNCLKANKHVFVEKPLTMSLETSLDLKNLAKEKGLIVHVDLTFLYSAEVNFLKNVIEFRQLGKLISFESVRSNFGPFLKDVGVNYDLMPHDAGIIRYLFPWLPSNVRAHSIGTLHNGVFESINAKVNFYNTDFTSLVTVSWLSPKKIRKLVLTGEQGIIEINDGKFVGWFDFETKKTRDFILTSPQETLLTELKYFSQCLRTLTQPITNVDFACGVMEILDKTQKSLELNKKIEFTNERE